ncbi:hypothetical protein R3P38DRAFT_2574293 [Favolaschia claudopus]|uniref:DUF6589 domain-containing protein n=1 Tax=Favolaschia claudopus TaxID=2862362 RepID=A0AAV9ZMW1_9AGAR
MAENTSEPPIKPVRSYKKIPTLRTVASLDSIRTQSAPSASTTSAVLSGLSLPSQIQHRAAPRTPWTKMDDVLRQYGFDSLGEFFTILFYHRTRGVPDPRTKRHRHVVASFLQGRSKFKMADLITLLYDHPKSRAKPTSADAALKFSPHKPLTQIYCARPCLSSWATRLVGNHAYYRVGKLAHKGNSDKRARRHLRATTNGRTPRTEVVEWEDVSFSMEELAQQYKDEDEFVWYLTECFAGSRKDGKVVVKKNRPHPVIQVGAISSFLVSRNQYASGDLALPLGIWLFSTQAHVDIKRVFSRLGYAVSDPTARAALNSLTDSDMNTLHASVGDAMERVDADEAKIIDNIQRYVRVYEHGLGKESELKVGTACTILHLENCKPGAFRADDHIARVIAQDRQKMTTESLYKSIDWAHNDQILELHFVRILVEFIPLLNHYSSVVSARFRTMLAKHRIPVHKSVLQPLGTNTEREVENKGMYNALLDFDKQMGVDPKKCDNILSWVRGDGASHATVTRLKRILATTPDIYSSFRNVITTPELWHTKATDLNSCASNHYGPAAAKDPSSLSRSSNATNMKRPTDLKKCDFYPTSRSMTMIYQARVLDCWRLILGCDDELLSHFEELVKHDALPSFDDLLEQASILRERYACQGAYQQSLDKADQDAASTETKFPVGSPWSPVFTSEVPSFPANVDVDMPAVEEDAGRIERNSGSDPEPEPSTTSPPQTRGRKGKKVKGPTIHVESPDFDGDRVLSNAVLFLMEFSWWTELNYAIPEGDIGRVLEILKIYIFTFGGTSNQNYMAYLLDLYTLLEFECSPDLKEAILNNFILNLRGEDGHGVEGDVVQEWNNKWLQGFSGRCGGEFDDTFYRKTISPNVLHFLKMKEDIESAFDLKRRGKSHTSPHLRNETKILLKLYRDEELHTFRSGRSMGHAAVNRFDRGYQRLDGEKKLKEYLERTGEYAEMLCDMEVIRSGAYTAMRRSELSDPFPSPPKSNSPVPATNNPESALNNDPSPTLSSDTSIPESPGDADDADDESDEEDNSDQPLESGSDLTVVIDSKTGKMSDEWYEEDEFAVMLGKAVDNGGDGDSDSEDEEPESDQYESESEGEE